MVAEDVYAVEVDPAGEPAPFPTNKGQAVKRTPQRRYLCHLFYDGFEIRRESVENVKQNRAVGEHISHQQVIDKIRR